MINKDEIEEQIEEIKNKQKFICCKCKKEIFPIVAKINNDGYHLELSSADVRGGKGNMELGKLCDKCYEKLKIELES